MDGLTDRHPTMVPELYDLPNHLVNLELRLLVRIFMLGTSFSIRYCISITLLLTRLLDNADSRPLFPGSTACARHRYEYG